ncbi:sugar ABC transporter substrate-binding protein [Nonomuraea roseoviolacea subsp. roseoviolacea]|uniref:Multiple sugar transport system substrate-binding protein n=1 Tax=Nonomuraea roseoviolacea subsp. carminata TaxID=160689 RepID=A0ABT1JUA6_9ACTN|nr:sugar ABC transporter substrate-binding protein [Nonomuraea roseoviolacea]MCP2344934.1 multiple sugar transport system substrate-binding protein [Nonomuraea roseoviolacea subsp. carminata]
MSRHLLRVALAATLAVTLTGCGSGGSGSGDDALEIWIRQAPDSASAKTAVKLADAFTKASGIKTKVVAIFDDFETKLQQQAAQRKLPDIVINDTAQLGNMHTQGWVREVDKAGLAGGDKLSDLAWKAAQGGDGKYYGVPFSAQAFALIIRKDWREKVGLDAPKTWEDLTRLAQAFTDKDPDGDGKKDTAGFVIPGGTKRGYASWYASSLIYANGGDFVKATGPGKFTATVNDPRTVEAVRYLQDQFCRTKTVNPGAVSNDTTVTHEVFEKGQGGIYLVGPYVLARFVKNVGTDKIEVVPVPKGPSGGPGTLGEGENVYLMAGSGDEEGQRKFAEFAASADGQRIGMNKDADGVIVRLPVNTQIDMAAERQDPRWKVFQESYANAVYAPPVPNWAPIRQTSADAINTVWADCSADVKSAMEALNTKLNQELQSQKAG